MQAYLCCRWLLVCFLTVSPCFLVSFARRGGGIRISRPSASRPSYSRPSPSYSRPSPSISRPAPSYPRPAPAPVYKPPPPPPVVNRQPAYNPNYRPIGPLPPVGHPAGPPPPYQASNQLGGSSGKPSLGQPPSYPQQPPANYPRQPPPYPGLPGRPPAYPGFSPSHQTQPGIPPYPRQPGHSGSFPQPPSYPGQPGRPPAYPGLLPSYQTQPGIPPYPRQPGHPGSYPQQPQLNRPYVVQSGHPGAYHPIVNKPYPVQPRISNPYPGVNRPYPQQSLGGNVWQPHYGMPSPAYMNYGGIPTGTNMHTKSHKKKGFIGSLMSLDKGKSKNKNKYYGSYPSPYGIGSSGANHGSFLGKHGSSAAMYSIFPYMVAKKAHKIHKPKFGFMPMYVPHHHYYHHHYRYDSAGGMNPEYAKHFDLYDDNYVGKCQRPIQKNHKVNCSTTFGELQCIAKCEEGYKFPNGTESVTNKCWHVTGIWKPKKNYPVCLPVCNEKCLNGGECIAPEVCECPAEYRGSQCEFHFLRCNILQLIKEENLSWTCNHHRNETICNIKCKGDKEFDLSPGIQYRCTPDGVWKPDTLPLCDESKS